MECLKQVSPEEWQDVPVLRQFVDDLPSHPYCTDAKGYCYIRNKSHALRHAYLQPNHPAIVKWIWLDIDDPQALFAYHDRGLPPPQLIVKNRTDENDNGHAHYGLRLAIPMGLGGRSSVKAMRYLASVQKALAIALGADRGYGGNLIKNPLSREHETYIVQGVQPSYTLEELANYLDLEPYEQANAVNDSGYGRNCTLFDELRHIAYKLPNKSYRAVESHLTPLADDINNRFDIPLLPNEVKHIIRSIARYCSRTDFTESHKAFSELQRARVTKRWGDSTDKQRQARQMYAEGVKKTDIAKQLGVTPRTLTNWGLSKKKK